MAASGRLDRSIVVFGGRDVGYDSWYDPLVDITEKTGLQAWYSQAGDFVRTSPRAHGRSALRFYDEARECTKGEVFVVGESYGALLATYIASVRPLQGLVLCEPVIIPTIDQQRNWRAIDAMRTELEVSRTNAEVIARSLGSLTTGDTIDYAALFTHVDGSTLCTQPTIEAYEKLLQRTSRHYKRQSLPALPHSLKNFNDEQRQIFINSLREVLEGWLALPNNAVDLVDSSETSKRLQQTVMQHS